MSLLTTVETRNVIASQVASATDTLHIISAFCKESAMSFIEANIKNELSEKKLMVRFLLSDILSGATDYSLYEFCKLYGWQMYVRFDLHAKTYVFDKKKCILGSSNMTSNGIGLNSYGNYELSNFTDINDSDLIKINKLFDDSILMTDELYSLMKAEYDTANLSSESVNSKAKWTNSIETLFKPTIDVLFTYDFPSTPHPDFNDIKSFEFLELNYIPKIEELQEIFRWCRPFLWLYGLVNSSFDKTMYFGKITKELHSTLINDPKPYRKEVKDLLSNLLGWIKALEIETISIDCPSHSQRIRCVENCSEIIKRKGV